MRVLTFLVFAMLLMGCGTNYMGVYTGNGAVTRGAGQQEQIVMTVQAQSGGQISGVWGTNPAASSGTFQGVYDGKTITQLNFVFANVNGQPCAGALQGSGSYANSVLTLNLSGSAQCLQGPVNTSIQFVHQPQ